MKNFKNKVALITGAGSGIGRALATQLAESGCNLALVDWNEETLKETEEIVRKKNVSVSLHPFDLREKEKIESLPDEIIEIHNQIDVVINNAGLSIIGTVDEVDEEDWNFGVDILLNAVIQMSTVFLPYLQKRPEAAIVNVSSIFGLFSVPKQSIYNVGKFGVKAFTESLSLEMEMSESPVEVYCVFPGHIVPIYILLLALRALKQMTQVLQFLGQKHQQLKRLELNLNRMHLQAQNLLLKQY